MSAIVEKIDQASWKYLPDPLKAVIRREAWIKLLVVYAIMLSVMIYRFLALKKSLLFHAVSPIKGDKFEKADQLKEAVLHVVIFLIPGFLASAFNRPPRNAQNNRE